MISIIICSASTELLILVKKNIAQTIGIAHEILAYDNSEHPKGICQIYNRGVRDAKFNILCFMHEDIEIHTPGWGINVVSSFAQNSRLGLLGIAGSSLKTFSPSGWDSTCMREKINYTNIHQKYKYAIRNDETMINKNDSKVAGVAVIDGVWFCSTKEVLSKNQFDEILFKKFHGYDIDISLTVGQIYDLEVSTNVFLTHLSEGNFNKEWVEETLLLHKKWIESLPINKAGLSQQEVRKCEKHAFKSFINTMRNSGISSLSCIQVLNRSRVRQKYGLTLYAQLCVKCLSR